MVDYAQLEIYSPKPQWSLIFYRNEPFYNKDGSLNGKKSHDGPCTPYLTFGGFKKDDNNNYQTFLKCKVCGEKFLE